jgi:hypothetical protein
VLTALGERDATVRETERRAGVALRTMIDAERLSVLEAFEWCASGVTLREVSAGVQPSPFRSPTDMICPKETTSMNYRFAAGSRPLWKAAF